MTTFIGHFVFYFEQTKIYVQCVLYLAIIGHCHWQVNYTYDIVLYMLDGRKDDVKRTARSLNMEHRETKMRTIYGGCMFVQPLTLACPSYAPPFSFFFSIFLTGERGTRAFIFVLSLFLYLSHRYFILYYSISRGKVAR